MGMVRVQIDHQALFRFMNLQGYNKELNKR